MACKDGDLVWIMIKKKILPIAFGKLEPRTYGLFKVVKLINDHAYQIDLHGVIPYLPLSL